MDENKKKMIFYVGLAGCFLWSAVLMVTAPMTPILAGIRDLQGKLKFSKSDFASKEMVLWTIVIFAAVLLAISIGLAVAGCGRREADGSIHRNWFDRWLPELHICIGIFCGTLFIPISIGMYSAYFNWELPMKSFAGDGAKTLNACMILEGYHMDLLGDAAWISAGAIVALMILATVLVAGIGMACLLALVRNLKNKTLFAGTILGRLYPRLVMLTERSENFYRKLLIALILLIFLSCTPLGLVVALLLVIFLFPKYYRKYDEVKKGIHAAAAGDFSYRIHLEGTGEFQRLAQEVNAISEAKEKALESEMRSQRMKTELITNVSHDLRTPLTSIITYVDLLKKAEPGSEEAAEYLEVLESKSKRLNHLVNSLFDAAKASSGDIPVEWMNVDMKTLTEQALGEFSDDFEKNNLTPVFHGAEESTMVYADGKLMFRIMENLLGNVKKYAMAGSRVYVDLVTEGSRVILTVKNISAAPLNITASDLMERSVRGDDSRNTEGSGLGLSIAGDLAELMKGHFRVEIDGDLFKAVLTMPRIFCETEPAKPQDIKDDETVNLNVTTSSDSSDILEL